MAETQAARNEGTQLPPNGDDRQEATYEDLQKQLADANKKIGRLTNDNASSKKKLSEYLKQINETEDAKARESEEREQAEIERAKQQGDGREIEQLLDNQRKKFEKDRQALEAKLDAERGLNNTVLLDSVLRNALSKVVDDGLMDGAFALHRSKVKMIEDPEAEYGRMAVVAVGDEFLTVDEYVKNWSENDEKAVRYLKPSLAGGGGAPGGSHVAGRKRWKPRKLMSAAEKSEAIRALGKAAYDKLPWDAE